MTLLTAKPILKIGDRLVLSLFEDAVLEASISDVTVYPNNAVGMTARLDGRFEGTLYLTYSGNELRVSADIQGGNDYYVSFDPETRQHIAIEVDRAASNELGCKVCDEPVAGTEGIPLATSAANGSTDLVANDPSATVVVDVMVVYTSAAKLWEGGLNGINNNIAMAMQKANAVHGNSDTKVVLNLVHAAETTYVESGSSSTDLDRLTYVGGSYSDMDEVQGWRNTYAADMVCLFAKVEDTGGLGWLLNSTAGRPDFAFCLARVQQTDFSYTVVHEWGHNMGCGHSKTQSIQQGPGLYSYSAGWQWNDTASSASLGFCSVMTYENFDNAGGNEYVRLPYFSNPDINYTGNSTNPTGDATDGDSARTIRNMRNVLAAYRTGSGSGVPSTNNFEEGSAPWIAYGGDVVWTLNSGPTPSSSTGPSAAYEGANYAYLEASGNENKTGMIQANFDFSLIDLPEIDFAYHMYGSTMGGLYLESSTNSGASWSTRWSMSGNQGNAWYPVTVSLGACAGKSNVWLRFRGVVGSTYTSDMALDAIVVRQVEDLDGDGIPNSWELLYFGGSTNAVATADPDGDGSDNYSEYVAGTLPNNAGSVFKVVTYAAPATGNAPFIVTWNPVAGRIYNVDWSQNLPYIPFTNISGDLPYPANSYTDSVDRTDLQNFYRVDVRLDQ
ncbi:MAG: hypothetical protein K9L89_07965 [Kiritimatiellales bacterium]|nr:hypothetical protein [Kiritimatiellales bacterium]